MNIRKLQILIILKEQIKNRVLVFQHLSSSNNQVTFLGGILLIKATAEESLEGFYFLVALDIIERMLIHTEETFRAGVQSL